MTNLNHVQVASRRPREVHWKPLNDYKLSVDLSWKMVDEKDEKNEGSFLMDCIEDLQKQVGPCVVICLQTIKVIKEWVALIKGRLHASDKDKSNHFFMEADQVIRLVGPPAFGARDGSVRRHGR